MNYYNELKKGLEQNHILYKELKDGLIGFNVKGKNINHIYVFVVFSHAEDNEPWIKCDSLGKFDWDKRGAGLLACNAANKQCQWVRFYIDDDGNVVADVDLMLSEGTYLRETGKMISRLSQAVDAVYPVFMKARWGD